MFFGAGLLGLAEGHGAIVSPAMRFPAEEYSYCPFCQGEQTACEGLEPWQCVPASTCFGAKGAQTVPRSHFPVSIRDLKHADGSYWIDEHGGTSNIPVYCPGDTIPTRYYINADHNGYWHWESQLAAPGEEVEFEWTMISERISVNNYVRNGVQYANYFASSDGLSTIPAGTCTGSQGLDWRRDYAHCMDNMFAEVNLTLPANMSPGATVLRWRWYGGVDENGMAVSDDSQPPEKSLFVNCKDIHIGTPDECTARSTMV